MGTLLTKWDVADIQTAITLEHRTSNALFMPNISFGFFRQKSMEADLLQLRGRRLEEYEIKRSREDFKADFKKPEFHSDVRILALHFVLPEAMAGEWLKSFCEKNYKTFKRAFDFMFYREYDCSIIKPEYHNGHKVDPKFTTRYYLTDDMIAYIKAHDPSTPYYRRLFAEEISELFRLVTIRYWTHARSRFQKSREAFMERNPHNPETYMTWYERERYKKERNYEHETNAGTAEPDRQGADGVVPDGVVGQP